MRTILRNNHAIAHGKAATTAIRSSTKLNTAFENGAESSLHSDLATSAEQTSLAKLYAFSNLRTFRKQPAEQDHSLGHQVAPTFG